MNAPHTVPAEGKPKPRLLDHVGETIRVKHDSPRTEDAYIGWIKRFIFFHGTRHRDPITEPSKARFSLRPIDN